MEHKRMKTGKTEGSSVESGRLVTPVINSAKHARVEDGDLPSVDVPGPFSVPEDEQLCFSKVVDAMEVGVDPATYRLLHGFWVPSALVVTYSDIIERFSGHMVK